MNILKEADMGRKDNWIPAFAGMTEKGRQLSLGHEAIFFR